MTWDRDQLPMFDADHDGDTYNPATDRLRLNRQQSGVYRFMSDGRWHTLHEIAEGTGFPEASVSARIRDFRKAKFGGFTVGRDHLGGGLYRYRLLTQ